MSAVYSDFGALANHGSNVVAFYLSISVDDKGAYIIQGSDVSQSTMSHLCRVQSVVLQEAQT